jgi:hypothetical protein
MPVGPKKRKPPDALGQGFFLPQPLRWYSALLVGMFYAQRVNAGKLIFSIDTFF